MAARVVVCLLAAGWLIGEGRLPAPRQRLSDPALAPRQGWVAAPGGHDLIRGGQWECASVYPPGYLYVGDGRLATRVYTGTDFVSGENVIGPHLEVRGDFGVLASVTAADLEKFASLTLTGAFATGPEFWRGLKRLELAPGASGLTVLWWDGLRPESPARFFYTGPLAGRIYLEVSRRGREFEFYVNGQHAGSIDDIGLFDRGRVHFGFNVAPGNRLTVDALAAVAPVGQEQNVRVVSLREEAMAPTPRGPGSLAALGSARGLLIGSEAKPIELMRDRQYRETLAREFALVTPSYPALFFAAVHPLRDTYSFCVADAAMDFAEANGLLVRGHTLVWHEVLPDWLTGANFSRDELIQTLRDHIHTVVGRYRGRVFAWDVVSEAVDPEGRLRDTFWLRGIGPEYIDLAFRWAREADPTAKLFYNDFLAEGAGPKPNGVYNLVRGLRQRGVPIDGVGMQMHLLLNVFPEVQDVVANMNRLGQLGLQVHITEMDVALRMPPAAPDLSAQAELYRRMMRACLSAPACKAFITWGFTDRHSWIPVAFPGLGAPLPLDENYRPKPAYYSLVDVLTGR